MWPELSVSREIRRRRRESRNSGHMQGWRRQLPPSRIVVPSALLLDESFLAFPRANSPTENNFAYVLARDLDVERS